MSLPRRHFDNYTAVLVSSVTFQNEFRKGQTQV